MSLFCHFLKYLLEVWLQQSGVIYTGLHIQFEPDHLYVCIFHPPELEEGN